MGIESLEAAFSEQPAIEPVAEIDAPEVLAETPTPEAIEAPIEQEPVKEEVRTVPLPTFLDQRDELKEAKRRLAELEARQQPTQTVPDPYDAPEEYAQFQDQKIQSALIAQRFQMSELMAKQAHGDDAVNAAAEWAEGKAKADPAFASAYMRELHPIDWIVRQHQRDSIVSQLPSDIKSLDELIEREIAKRGLTAPAVTTPVTVQPAPSTPRRSLASEPSKHGAIREIPTGPLAALGAIFG